MELQQRRSKKHESLVKNGRFFSKGSYMSLPYLLERALKNGPLGCKGYKKGVYMGSLVKGPI